MDFVKLIEKKEYDFLREEEHLAGQVVLLGMAGSYSYGTNVEGSDVDVRGVAMNRRSDLLGLTRFEQYVDEGTDTTIYSMNKIIRLLMDSSPNVIELLGLKREHYLQLSEIGRRLVEERKMFLSKRVKLTFGGYADAQLRRLQNALARDSYPQAEKEQHIYNSLKNSMDHFRQKYAAFEAGQLRIYVDEAENPALEKEIFLDAALQHYPLRDYQNIWSEMHNIVKDYDKLGKRNRKKDEMHLNKHAMHLIRLLITGIDILENGDIHTYREKEHDLLMEIRGGRWMKEDGTYRKEFYDMVTDYELRLEEAAEKSSLPEEPDTAGIQTFLMWANEKVVRGEKL